MLYKIIIAVKGLLVKSNQVFYKKSVITATAIAPGTPAMPTISAERGLSGRKEAPKSESNDIISAPTSEFSKRRKSPLVLSENKALNAPTVKSPNKKEMTISIIKNMQNSFLICYYLKA